MFCITFYLIIKYIFKHKLLQWPDRYIDRIELGPVVCKNQLSVDRQITLSLVVGLANISSIYPESLDPD